MFEFRSVFAPLIHDFIRFRLASQKWNDTYESNLGYFDQHCAANYPDETALSQEMVDSWCRKRVSETNNSCRARIFVIVAFIKYLRKRGFVSIIPPAPPRGERCIYIPHAFTQDELKRFFHECDSLTVHNNRKADRARKITVPVFFRLLYSSGIRTNEARMLKRPDIDLETGVMSIRNSKGDDQHFNVLHDSMLELMRVYDQAIKGLYPDRLYFFPAGSNGYHKNGWVIYNFDKLWGAANPSHATAYDVRHHYAIKNINKWIDDGFDFFDKLVYLSKSMGHKNIENTKYYYSLVPAMANILRNTSEDGFNDLIPEVPEDEEEQC